jgi:rRNA processing protein Krr1/Pno1
LSLHNFFFFLLARKQTSTTSTSSNSSTSSGSNTNLHYNSLIYPSISNNLQQITIQVRVPYRVVGLVVGPKGATIKRIQQTTNTYIVTPGRDKEPVFEIAGLPENVEAAKIEIESHIAARTGQTSDIDENDFEKELYSIADIIDTNQQCSKWIKLNNPSSSSSTTTTKFAHHLSLPFPQDEKIKSTYRTISQSSFFPTLNDQLDFNSSFEQISDEHFDSIWPNLNLISMKTSMGFA